MRLYILGCALLLAAVACKTDSEKAAPAQSNAIRIEVGAISVSGKVIYDGKGLDPGPKQQARIEAELKAALGGEKRVSVAAQPDTRFALVAAALAGLPEGATEAVLLGGARPQSITLGPAPEGHLRLVVLGKEMMLVDPGDAAGFKKPLARGPLATPLPAAIVDAAKGAKHVVLAGSPVVTYQQLLSWIGALPDGVHVSVEF